MVDIIVEVRGGVVVEVYSKDASQRVAIVDWDNIETIDQRERVVVESCASYESLPTETRRISQDSGCL